MADDVVGQPIVASKGYYAILAEPAGGVPTVLGANSCTIGTSDGHVLPAIGFFAGIDQPGSRLLLALPIEEAHEFALELLEVVRRNEVRRG